MKESEEIMLSAACLEIIAAVCAEGEARSDVYPSPATAAAIEYGLSRGWLLRAGSGYAVTVAGLAAIEHQLTPSME